MYGNGNRAVLGNVSVNRLPLAHQSERKKPTRKQQRKLSLQPTYRTEPEGSLARLSLSAKKKANLSGPTPHTARRQRRMTVAGLPMKPVRASTTPGKSLTKSGSRLSVFKQGDPRPVKDLEYRREHGRARTRLAWWNGSEP